MLKRDSLTAQMQQLSHTLAKVKRLIQEGQLLDGNMAIEDVLGDYYGTNVTYLLETPANLFVQALKEQGFVAEEVSLLAGFLDELAGLQADPEQAKKLWQKVINLYDLLETYYKIVSFEHLSRRAVIMGYLS